MDEVHTEGKGNVPERPVLVMPNRVTPAVMKELEQALGGPGRVAWMIESNLRPSPAIMQHLQSTRARGMMYSLDDTPAQVGNHVRRFMEQGCHVVFLPGRPAQLRGTLSDMPARMLTFLQGAPVSILPVYCGMFNDGIEDSITTEEPYDSVQLRLLPPIKPGPAQSARVLNAWMEAQADLLASHPMAEAASMGHLLISALKEHPEACLIDGVNDSPMLYLDLLVYAIRLAGILRKRTSHKRLGIILPPGKLATISNVACFLAGIVPVNINYTAPEHVFKACVNIAGVDRFITEERFMTKQSDFAWPRSRDLIFPERELADMKGGRMKLWQLLVQMTPPERIAAHLKLPDTPQPDSEAALLFTSGSSGTPKGVPLTNRMIICNLMESQSRLDLKIGDTFLSSLPIFHSFGLTIGMLMPLIFGYDVVTYPSPLAVRRLCELIRHNKVRLTVTTPTQVRHMFHVATEDTFKSVDYFITSSEPLTSDLSAEAHQRFHLNLWQSYGLTEASPVVSVNLPAPIPLEGQMSIPTARSGSIGVPLPGVAVRILDPGREDHVQPFGTAGMIWLRGPSIMKAYLNDEEATQARTRGNWFCTGDIGKLDSDGILTILGRRNRFSKIGGEMIPHEHVEQLLLRLLKAPTDEPSRKIAIIGLPDHSKGERLIMLSTLHKTPHPHDLITIRYSIMNAGYPPLWCPDIIVPVPEIPELPNGKLNYPLCRQIAEEATENKN